MDLPIGMETGKTGTTAARCPELGGQECYDMAYHGEDLDLRTPQTFAAPPGDFPSLQADPLLNGPRGRSGFGAQRGGPIWVDETVLACCNHAFDVAVAHRALEVRLEHLLYALTRIETAAQVLEMRGVRVSPLRRELALVIASEIPVAGLGVKSPPRRSDDIEDVLRAAAALAYRRNGPASIEDVIQVLLDAAHDVSSLAHLRPFLVRREAAAYQEQPMPFVRPGYPPDAAADPRYGRTFYSEPPRAYPEAPRPGRLEAPSTTDNIQNARLETLEQMVRSLSNDLSTERRTFMAALQDIQREVLQHRDESRTQASNVPEGAMIGFTDRLTSLESALTGIKTGSPADLSPVHDRLGTIERALNVLLSDTARASDTISAKVALLETELKRTQDARDLSPVVNRLDIIEEAVLSRDGEGGREVLSRLKALEDAMSAGRERATTAEQTFTSEFKALSAAIDRQRGDLALALLTPLNERLEEIGGDIGVHYQESARGLEKLGNQFGSFEASVSEFAVKSAEAGAASAERLADVHETVARLVQAQQAMQAGLDKWRQDIAVALNTLGARLDQVTGRVEAATTNVSSGLNLIGTRLDIVGQRVEAVEKQEAATVPMLETLAGTVDRMHRVTVERYHRRNRFWYWLFGTDDWLGASWPSQTAKISEELRAVKVDDTATVRITERR